MESVCEVEGGRQALFTIQMTNVLLKKEALNTFKSNKGMRHPTV